MRKWTVRIKSFIFCCCGPFNSQNEAQEVSEKLKNCRREHQNCVSRDLSRRSTPGPPETAAGTLRTQNLGDIPATAAQSPLQPRPQLIVWKFQSVNNGGDESFFACSSIESIIYQWDVLGWVIAEHEETDKRKLE